MERMQEYKNQSIILFGFENPITIEIFKLAELAQKAIISAEVALFNMDTLLARGLKEEFNV